MKPFSLILGFLGILLGGLYPPSAFSGGTLNAVAKFDGSGNPAVDSLLYDNGTSVGIGTTTPTTKLDVRGFFTLDPGSDPVIYTGTAASEQQRYLQLINSPAFPSASGLKAGRVVIADTYSYATAGNNELIVKGNTGIGTPLPQSKLHVAGRADPVAPFSGVLIDQTLLAAASPGSYSLQIRTTDQSGLSKLNLQATTRTDLLVDSAGNVGIGTDTPNHRLSIAGGPEWTSNRWGGSVELTNGSAIGWQPNAAGQRFGIGHTNGGLYFFHTSSNLGTTTNPAQYDLIIHDDQGLVEVNTLKINGADLSEAFDVGRSAVPGDDKTGSPIQAGMVVSIDTEHPGKLVISNHGYDRRVAGIISGAGDMHPGVVMDQPASIGSSTYPVALNGRAYCWADASNGPIEPGDLLTTSDTAAHAMKVTDHSRARGAIIGKAMTGLRKGKGLVLVLVALQ
jgi:hypothetical protein